MSEKSGQGRWDHLLREIPTRSVKQTKQNGAKVSSSAVDEMSRTKRPVMGSPSPDLTPKKAVEPSRPASQPTLFEEQEPEEHVYKVSDINRAIKQRLEGDFVSIWVQGEISNFKAHSSGHYYFSLKDEKSQINAVMFKGFNAKLRFKPESGLEVIVRGKISVYEPRGNYQVFCESMEPVGAGALQKAFEQLKEKLNQEGLFDPSKKMAIPEFPKKVGVVTSPTGAAIQDILNVLGRRSKRVQVVVIPARVQGDGAAKEVVRGIEMANKLNDFDVLIVGRGGGSIEDMWCFNEEIVARAIFASKIPIISSVGHEIDFTIADFVADLRAPTPSAAAEVVAKSEQELVEKLKFFSKSLRLLIYQKISDEKKHIQVLQKGLFDPRKYLQDSMLRLDDWSQRLIQSTLRFIEQRKVSVKMREQALKRPDEFIQKKKQAVSNLEKMLFVTINQNLKNLKSRFVNSTNMLDSLSPLRVLDRGYAIVRTEKQLVTSVEAIQGESIEVELKDGFVDAQVKGTRKKTTD